MANYITVEDFKALNPYIDTSQFSDTTISGMIGRASKQVDNYINYSLDVEDIVDEKTKGNISTEGDLVIFVKKRPIVSVSSISIVKGTTSIDLNLSDNNSALKYDLPSSLDRIVYPDDEIAFNSVSIIRSFYDLMNRDFFVKFSYRAGYTTIPADIEDAINLYMRDQFARALNVPGASSIKQGGITISYNNGGRSDGKSDNILDAENILIRYKRNTPFY